MDHTYCLEDGNRNKQQTSIFPTFTSDEESQLCSGIEDRNSCAGSFTCHEQTVTKKLDLK